MTDDSVTRLMNEFATDDPNVVLSHIPFQDDDMLQNLNANDKVIIIADTRHTQRWSERKVDAMWCKGDLVCFCYLSCDRHRKTCVSEHTSVRLVSHETWMTWKRSNLRTSLVPGTEDDQAEQHGHGTIDQVLGDPDMERGGDDPEVDREVDLPERIPLPDHSESRPYSLTHVAGIDVFEIINSVSKRFIVGESENLGSPSSREPDALFSSEQRNLIRSSVFRNANPSNLRGPLPEGNKDHLLNQARSELAKQELHVESLNKCIGELQRQTEEEILALQDAEMCTKWEILRELKNNE